MAYPLNRKESEMCTVLPGPLVFLPGTVRRGTSTWLNVAITKLEQRSCDQNQIPTSPHTLPSSDGTLAGHRKSNCSTMVSFGFP